MLIVHRQSSNHKLVASTEEEFKLQQQPAKMKRKARYSRAEKRERKRLQEDVTKGKADADAATAAADETKPTFQPRPTKKRKKTTFLQRVIKCADESLHTQSVMLGTIDDSEKISSIRIFTGCDTDGSRKKIPPDSATTCSSSLTIRIQPLLILDLNGILCHRSRSNKGPGGVQLRPSIGTMAQTDIIPRTDLATFLRFLDKHFCLAIWTSAKRRTAKRLLTMLIPEGIKSRLLFVWGQNYCCQSGQVATSSTSDPDNAADDNGEGDNDLSLEEESDDEEDEDGIIYEKRLDKVWKAFPLWSADNTLLVDDSPEKCGFAVASAIHPPAIHGQRNQSIQSSSSSATPADGPSDNLSLAMSDEDNEKLQLEFFEQLVSFWSRQPYLQMFQKVHKKKSHNLIGEKISNTEYLHFMETSNAARHVGWRGNDIG